ncbi:MAG: DNA polymerase IV [Gammaproteobacteria bacterium]|nr:DNA polymerase IV [Gammaproteobacteria bacterium]
MNAFFASVEQLDNPQWRNHPVAITNGAMGSCIITCSYEARAFGIKTGMRLPEARRLCPELLQIPSRPRRYAEISTRIMQTLATITPDMEIFSVDEAFLDVTHCQTLHGTPPHIAQMARQRIFAAVGLLCSAGVSGDKTTAKFAAKLKKPDGLTVIPPWEARQRLADVPVTELCGINRGIGQFLAVHGVERCGDMQRLPIQILCQRFGERLGRRLWLMAQGADPEPLETQIKAPKSIGHGKVMPPDTRDLTTIKTYLRHMAHKVAARLRQHQLLASHFLIALRTQEMWISLKEHTITPCDEEQPIYQLALRLLLQLPPGKGVFQVQITALNPGCAAHRDLFSSPLPRRRHAATMMDRVNQRYGQMTLASARLIHISPMPDVIAPSWRPDGHRRTV